MNRDDLKTLAQLRVAESRALLNAGHPSGAYYLAGYAVECALKAVIAGQTQQYEFPDRQRALDSFVHDLKKLSIVADLDGLMNIEMRGNSTLRWNWDYVIGWSQNSRYLVYEHDAAKADSYCGW